MTRTDKILEWFKNNRVFSIVVIITIGLAGFASTLKNIHEISDFFGLTKHGAEQPNKRTIQYPIIPDSAVKGIATSILKEEPQFYGYKNIYGYNYILTFTKSNGQFQLFKQFDSSWEQVQHVDSLNDFNTFFSPEDWEFTVIDSLPTLFFANGNSGNAFGSADFYVILLNKTFHMTYIM